MAGGSVGQLSSSEITLPGCRPIGPRVKATRCARKSVSPPPAPRSLRTCACVDTLCSRTERSHQYPPSYTMEDRSGKVCGHNPGMSADEKSGINMVPKKAPNNGAQATVINEMPNWSWSCIMQVSCYGRETSQGSRVRCSDQRLCT